MEHFFGLHKGHLTGKADRIAEKAVMADIEKAGGLPG